MSKTAGRKLTGSNSVAGFAVLASTEQQLAVITKRSRRSDYPASGMLTAPFKGKTVEEIYEHFLSLVGPMDGVPAMFGMHTFVMLDKQTAEDQETCLLVSDNDGRVESRRAQFEVALFHLVCLETLMLEFGQCGVRDKQVLTAAMVGREQYEDEEGRWRGVWQRGRECRKRVPSVVKVGQSISLCGIRPIRKSGLDTVQIWYLGTQEVSVQFSV